MIKRYSGCHFADVMFKDELSVSSFLGECSFCGKGCSLIEVPFTVGYDVELTLRRWSDGDCTVDDMFERLTTEYRRIFNSVVEPAQKALMGDAEPKFKYNVNNMSWEN